MLIRNPAVKPVRSGRRIEWRCMMSAEAIVILMLLAFIVGMMTGIALVRPVR